MKNQTQKLTEDKFAKNEPPITTNDLLAEIKPLFEDYFIGEISFDGQNIAYCLPNGQKFKLSAEEVA